MDKIHQKFIDDGFFLQIIDKFKFVSNIYWQNNLSVNTDKICR